MARHVQAVRERKDCIWRARHFCGLIILIASIRRIITLHDLHAEVFDDTGTSSHSPLDVVVWSSSGCDGIDCEDRLGGSRIWCTNLGAGLKRLGHLVEFTQKVPVGNSYDVIVAHASKLTSGAGRRFNAVDFAWDTDILNVLNNKAKILVLVKPNGVPTTILNKATAIPFGSLLHFMYEVENGLQPHRGWCAKHIEVPLQYWKQSIHVPQVSMYDFIPRHSVFTRRFTAERPAKICYHGSFDHLNEPGANDMLQALDALQTNSTVPSDIFIITGEGKSAPTRSYFRITKWSSVDALFRFLATCDLGLVPNLSRPPSLSDSGELAYPELKLSYKISSNAGRAFVYAQVGLPFVGHPESELFETLGTAGIDAYLATALGSISWQHKISHVLTDVQLRRKMSGHLRSFSEKHLTIEKLSKQFELQLRKQLRKRQDVRT